MVRMQMCGAVATAAIVRFRRREPGNCQQRVEYSRDRGSKKAV